MKARETKFEQLYLQTKNILYSYVKKFISQPNDIQDILQQCYLKLWTRIDEIADDENILPLLFTYARNLVIDAARKSATEKKNLAGYGYNTEHTTDFRQQLDSRESIREINKAISEMPVKRRKIFLMRKEQGLSASEIAARLNISERVVHKHLSAAMRYLRIDFRR